MIHLLKMATNRINFEKLMFLLLILLMYSTSVCGQDKNHRMSEQTNLNCVLLIDSHPFKTPSNAFNYLIGTQGVSMNGQGNIFLAGNEATVIYLDDKPIEICGMSQVEFLKSLGQKIIDKIEVMFNPPDKYRLPKGVGLVNIITIKQRKNKMSIIPIIS